MAGYHSGLTKGKAEFMRYFTFAVGLLISCSIASAQYSSSGVSVGYSHFDMGHATGLFYNHDGGYIDLNAAWRAPGAPVLAGFGVSGSGFYERMDDQFSNRLYSDVGLFSLEGRLALPLSLKEVRGWFLLPRIGAGLLVDSYGIDRDEIDNDGFSIIHTDWHDGAAFEVRPDLQAGYSWGRGSVGADVSYMAAWGDFGGFSSSAQEFRAGVFFSFRY
jgi:hypothetical protein